MLLDGNYKEAVFLHEKAFNTKEDAESLDYTPDGKKIAHAAMNIHGTKVFYLMRFRSIKNNYFRQALALLLTLCLMFSLLPTTAYGADVDTADTGYNLTVTNVTAGGLKAAVDAILSSELGASPTADDYAKITSLTISGGLITSATSGTEENNDWIFIRNRLSGLETLDLSGITNSTIPNYALSNNVSYANGRLSNLRNVTLSSVVRSIGTYAFRDCASLALTELPSGVTSIGSYAFSGCTSLALTKLPSGVTSIGSDVFFGCTRLALTELPSGLTSIGDYAFSGCTSLALTKLPSGLTSIGSYAFYRCTSLTLTTLPASLTGIGSYAFNGCTSLALTKLPSGVKSISGNAFSGCTSLALTELPAGVTSIGNNAFSGCTSLALTALPAGVTSIGYSTFNNCTGLALRELPAGVTSIDAYAFSGCTNLALTALPAGVTSIGFSTFYNCTSLALTTLPAGVTSIENSAFSGCTSLALTELPSGLTSIGDYAFSDCTSLALTELPSGLTSIGDSAFSGCTGLKLIVLPDAPPTVSSDAFINIPNLMVLVSDNAKNDYTTLFANLPATASLPVISGDNDLKLGDKLTLTVMPDVSSITGVTYQWKKDGTDISGATDRTYEKTNFAEVDGGSYTCVVSYGNKSYTTEATSVSSIALTGTPTIAITGGTLKSGAELTADIGTLPSDVTDLAYSWKAGGSEVGTGSTYTVKDSDAGKTITVTITAGNYTGSVTSSATAAVLYTVKLERSGNTGSDDLYFGTAGTLEAYAAADEEVTFSCIIGTSGTKSNSVSFTGGTVSKSGNNYSYIVDGDDAADGIITITATFSHVDLTAISIDEAVQTKAYTGETQSFTVITTTPDDGSIDGSFTVTYNQGEGDVEPINTGTYNVVIHRDADSDYEAFDKTITGGLIISSLVTVSFDANGGSGTMTSVSVPKGAYTLPSCTFQRSNYSFAGWKIGNSGVAYTAGEAITVNGDVTLFAQWTYNGDAFIPVTNIKDIPTKATVGTALALKGTVQPGDATNRTIQWSVKSEGTTGAKITNGNLKTTGSGTVVITATIQNGKTSTLNYTKDFTIKVTYPVKKGSTYTVSGYKYRVMSITNSKKEVTFIGLSDKKKKSAASLNIKDTVKVNGITMKVTAVGTNALKGNKKIKTVKIGNNVQTIGTKAFYRCTVLKSVTIGTGLKFIGTSAFWNDDKLKTTIIKSTKLNKIGIKAFYNVKATVKVPKSKINNYKKLLKGKGGRLKVTI